MNKTCIMVYGRYNPVHKGHASIFERGVSLMQSIPGSDFLIFTSTTHDIKNNPLPYDNKIAMICDYFPEFAQYVQTKSNNTIFDTLSMLDNQYSDLIVLCGSDRYVHFESVLNKYNGTLYTYDTIKIHNMGERDQSPYSSTVMRNAVLAGDFNSFCSCLPSIDNDMDLKYFKLMASHMGVTA